MKASYFKNKYFSRNIIFVFNLVNIFIGIIFYFLIPLILNYPPNSINNEFQLKVNVTKYFNYYILIVLIVMVIGNIFLKLILNGLKGWNKYKISESLEDIEKLLSFRQRCMYIPIVVYIAQVIIPLVMIMIILIILQTDVILTFKISIIVFTFTSLPALICYINTKRVFRKILYESFYEQIAVSENKSKIGLRNLIFLQMIPIILVSLVFTILIGYSRLVHEKGNVLFPLFMERLKNEFSDISDNMKKSDLEKKLNNISTDITADINKKNEHIKCIKFLIDPQKNVYTLDGNQLSKFFLEYLFEYANELEGRVYDDFGVDAQGAIINVKTSEGTWTIGIRYEVSSNSVLLYFLLSFLILLGLNIFVLAFFSNTLSGDVSLIARSLNEIADSNDVNLDKKLPVTSNDEIGDLVIAFNKIQQKEIDNIKSIKENQAILLEQERLASLGQLIGGIAHNLKTPIMSISGGIEALKDLAYEYRDSIDDKSVTEQDHKEIAKEMLSWLERMKPYCSYMSDVISAVKGQAVQMNASTTVKFTVDELVKRVDLLLKHELKKYHCVLNLESHIDMSTEIKGEVNNLVQVFDNIIINAMQAYDGQNGTIDLKIVRSGDNVEFTFRDYGKGIPKQVTDRLFKEMITTKGKNGTGLGLYMSYSTIKGRFGGNMSFTSKEGCGTTFFISIPCITYSNQEAG